MERESERLERRQLESLSTVELIQHALEEARLLARAEVLHAKKELREEVRRATVAGILLGSAGGLGLAGLTALFVMVGLALPMAPWLGVLLVALVLLLVAAVLALVGYRRLPKQPMAHTQERLKDDFTRTRETLQ